jgi:hypothetical protein
MPAELALKRSEALSNKLTDNGRWLLGALKKQLELAPDHDSKLAAIWHKGEFNGDVVAECFVGQMMDQSRGGGSYERYVKNMALSICADGKDLDSGYTCVFGEDNNSKSVILRHGKVVAEIPVGIPVKRNIHRKWFRMRAEKLGGDITFRVFVQDNPNSPEVQLVSLRYTDPEPLGGGRVAVWTYDNGIMVARMRISSPDEAVKESPFISYPLLSGCHYDAGIKTETAKKE